MCSLKIDKLANCREIYHRKSRRFNFNPDRKCETFLLKIFCFPHTHCEVNVPQIYERILASKPHWSIFDPVANRLWIVRRSAQGPSYQRQCGSCHEDLFQIRSGKPGHLEPLHERTRNPFQSSPPVHCRGLRSRGDR